MTHQVSRLLLAALGFLSVQAAQAGEEKSAIRFINPPAVAAPASTSYTHLAVIPAGFDLLVVAGQVGVRPDGTIPEDPAAQYEITLQNIVDILKSEGVSPSGIVKMNTYVARDLDIAKVREIRGRIFGKVSPPGTWVHVVKLAGPQYAVEVEVWAARPH